ncbi:MAG: hypothetical protein WCK31_03550 [bacterium]
MNNKINTLKFALSGGILVGGCFFFSTISTVLGLPGFEPFSKALESMYSFYGYSISFIGAFVGLLWGFIEGFLLLGILAWLYNKLNK